MASAGTTHSLRPVTNWLITGAIMIACMVVIGGITRLTGSGLSITEWKPIMGSLPPMNEAEWNIAFEKYKAIPEYTLVNQHLDLSGFKGIFFWEYLHRNWGRLMGVVFIVPFLFFWRRGLLTGWLMRRSLVILVGGGLVGALGWFMVKSGLEENPDVSHYRLAIHLCAAFIVMAIVLWTVFDIRRERRDARPDGKVGRWIRWVLVLLVIQIVWGAFTAGLDAGRIYNTWPLMNGEFMPENVRAFGSLIKDFTDHRDGVQFVHRNLAYLVAIAILLFGLIPKHTASLARPNMLMLVMVLVQFLLGVLTIIWQVPIVLGVLHQFGAVLLLSTVLNVVHRTGRPISAIAA
ncbi:MAG: COX15/CtaA family protein [Flavobacteriales bacterium]